VGVTVWLTGLPAAGKTTIGDAVAEMLRAQGHRCVRLDGDVLRRGLCADLGFGREDRAENNRRASHVAQLLAAADLIVVAAFVSPYAADRQLARAVHTQAGCGFLEVYLDTPLAECERRDPKGMYAKAHRGELPDFTGVDGVYEVPLSPDLIVRPAQESIEDCAQQIVSATLAL
jgi:bifunctional enzyme CysN/CysC